jgi:hypothetical protein
MDESKTPPTHLGSCRYLTFVPRGFGFDHHSIAILYHEVPNPDRFATFSSQYDATRAGEAKRRVGDSGGGRVRVPSPLYSDMTTLRKVDTSCTALSLMPTIIGNTVRSFSTHGHQSAAEGSSSTASRSDIRLILTF